MMDNREQNRAGSMLMLASSMLIFGTIGIFRRYIPLSSGLLAFARGVIGTAFLVLFAWLRKRGRMGKTENSAQAESAGPGRPEKTGKAGIAGSERTEAASETKEWHRSVILVLSGALIGINWILLFEAYNYTTVATATLCYYMQPVIVILGSALILGEKLSSRKLICVFIAILGMVPVSGILESLPTADEVTGILLALGAAALYGINIITNKTMKNLPSFDMTIFCLMIAGLTLLPYTFVMEDWGAMVWDMQSLLLLVTVGILHTGVAYALYYSALKVLKAQTVAMYGYIDPIFAIVLSALLLGEPLTVSTAVGGAMILGATYLSDKR
jgi:RarD protein